MYVCVYFPKKTEKQLNYTSIRKKNGKLQINNSIIGRNKRDNRKTICAFMAVSRNATGLLFDCHTLVFAFPRVKVERAGQEEEHSCTQKTIFQFHFKLNGIWSW